MLRLFRSKRKNDTAAAQLGLVPDLNKSANSGTFYLPVPPWPCPLDENCKIFKRTCDRHKRTLIVRPFEDNLHGYSPSLIERAFEIPLAAAGACYTWEWHRQRAADVLGLSVTHVTLVFAGAARMRGPIGHSLSPQSTIFCTVKLMPGLQGRLLYAVGATLFQLREETGEILLPPYVVLEILDHLPIFQNDELLPHNLKIKSLLRIRDSMKAVFEKRRRAAQPAEVCSAVVPPRCDSEYTVFDPFAMFCNDNDDTMTSCEEVTPEE